MNPIATIYLDNGKKIVIELLPDAAPNTVNSFISIAKKGLMDHYAIQRIVPGKWVDVSYSGFGQKDAQYLIPSEFELHPELQPIPSHFGVVCMGGYGEKGLAGGEFFFPLKDCPEHLGIYPVFGIVKEGLEEIDRIAKVDTFPVENFPVEGMEVNEPKEPQVIERVEVELFGQDYPEPIKVEDDWKPITWK